MKISKFLRIAAINIFTVLFLLFLVNQACGLYLKWTAGPSRAELPNYSENQAHAKDVFSDYNRLQYTYEPFVGWIPLPYSGKTTTISKSGLRINPEDFAQNGNRIVRFFGGSTMWGEGSDDQHTIPSLYKTLNPNDMVINHGQLAYNSRQNLDALISQINRLEKIDIVVFYDGVNDAAFLCPTEIEVPGHRLVPMFRKRLYSSKSQIVIEVFNKLFLEKIILLMNRGQPVGSDVYNCLSEDGKAESIADFLMTNWETANQVVTSRGGTFYGILQPASFVGSPQLEHLNVDSLLKENFNKVYQIIQQKLKERNYPWTFDLTKSMDGDDYIYIDFCHVSPNGNDLISKEISKIINTSELQSLE